MLAKIFYQLQDRRRLPSNAMTAVSSYLLLPTTPRVSLGQAIIIGLASAACILGAPPVRMQFQPANIALAANPLADRRLKPAALASDHSLVSASAPQVMAVPAKPSIAQRLRSAGLKDTYADLYAAAAQATHTPWQLLAAVHQVETNQSGSTSRRSSAGALGPMQFMPATFARYGLDGNHDGQIDITNLDDAMYAAGNYLAANGAGQGRYSAALYAYNHSSVYVTNVSLWARKLGL